LGLVWEKAGFTYGYMGRQEVVVAGRQRQASSGAARQACCKPVHKAYGALLLKAATRRLLLANARCGGAGGRQCRRWQVAGGSQCPSTPRTRQADGKEPGRRVRAIEKQAGRAAEGRQVTGGDAGALPGRQQRPRQAEEQQWCACEPTAGDRDGEAGVRRRKHGCLMWQQCRRQAMLGER